MILESHRCKTYLFPRKIEHLLMMSKKRVQEDEKSARCIVPLLSKKCVFRLTPFNNNAYVPKYIRYLNIHPFGFFFLIKMNQISNKN